MNLQIKSIFKRLIAKSVQGNIRLINFFGKLFPSTRNVIISSLTEELIISQGLDTPVVTVVETKQIPSVVNIGPFIGHLENCLTIFLVSEQKQQVFSSHVGKLLSKQNFKFEILNNQSCSHSSNSPQIKGRLREENWLEQCLEQTSKTESIVVVDLSSGFEPTKEEIISLHIENLANKTSIANGFRLVDLHCGEELLLQTTTKYLDIRMWGFSLSAIRSAGISISELRGTNQAVLSNIINHAGAHGYDLTSIPIVFDERFSEDSRLKVGCESCFVGFCQSFPYLKQARQFWNTENPISKAAKIWPDLHRNKILFIQPISGGGLLQSSEALVREISNKYEIYVLKYKDNSFEISKYNDIYFSNFNINIQRGTDAFSHKSIEYDYVFSHLLRLLNIDLFHVEHLAWQSLGISSISKIFDKPYVFSLHDYYSICASHNLLDENSVFCGGICTPGSGPCQTSLWPKNQFVHLKNNSIQNWKNSMRDFLSGANAIFSPSIQATEVLLNNYPELKSLTVNAPHSTKVAFTPREPRKKSAVDELKVLVLGDLGIPKGEFKIFQLSEVAQNVGIDIHLLGPIRPVLRNLNNHGPYEISELPELVSEINPFLAIIPSITKETFSHVLTEVLSLGLPVAAFQGSGAVEERIQEAGAGILLDPESTPLEWAFAIRKFIDDTDAYNSTVERISSWQQNSKQFDQFHASKPYINTYKKITDRIIL